jgi:hypothetical protein
VNLEVSNTRRDSVKSTIDFSQFLIRRIIYSPPYHNLTTETMIMITYQGRLVSFEDGIQSLLGHDTSNVWTLSLFLIKLTFDFYFLF